MTAFIATLAVMLPAPAPNVAVGEGHVRVDHRPAIVRPYRPRLMRIAWCESTWRWHIAGLYRGGLQFDFQTWRSVGGRGDPAVASKLEQLYRGALLYRRRGPAPWPVCGYR